MDCSTKTATGVFYEREYLMSVPSLRRTVIVYIVTLLWKQRNIRRAIKICTGRRHNYYKCHNLEKDIIEKLAQLGLPDMIFTELSNVVRPMRLSLMNFIDEGKRNYVHFHNSVDYIDSFRWDSDGIIDKVQTLKIQLENQRIDDAYDVYRIACAYCLENTIIDLWLKKLDIKCVTLYRDPFVIYWTHITQTEDPALLNRYLTETFPRVCNTNHSLFVNMVALSIWKGNVIAVKYFWQRLSIDEMAYHVEKWAEEAARVAYWNFQPIYKATCEYINTLVFFLPKLTDQQLRTLMQVYPEVSKLLLYNWPWQSLFLYVFDKTWDVMDGEVYADLLMSITSDINIACKNEDILKELWQRSPEHLNRYVVRNILDGGRCKNMLAMLMNVWHIQSIQLVLSCANSMEKKQMLSSTFRSDSMHNNIAYELLTSKLHLFTMLTASNSDHEIDEYKRDIIICRNWSNFLIHFITNYNWQEFERLFPHSTASQ